MGVVSLELNEINFDYVEKYCAKGLLPNFAAILERHDRIATDALAQHPALEPWIQWPTVYSGLSHERHGIFRLGDAVGAQLVQIWEHLEAAGLKVGAIMPMNGTNRCKSAPFFLPDPWTGGEPVGDDDTIRLYHLLGAMTRENAHDGGGTLRSIKVLLPLAYRFLKLRSLPQLIMLSLLSFRFKWAKAIVLDRLLADVFMTLWRRHKPDYASLFLNAGAHIQHHHTYDSAVYEGDQRNPAWYKGKAAEIDPLLTVYEAYDRIIGDIQTFDDNRVIITTGLSQTPNRKPHYQYRLIDYPGFLSAIGCRNFEVMPRMSRDFLVTFQDRADLLDALRKLTEFRVAGKPLFSADDRGTSLFCQVAYFGPPQDLDPITFEGGAADPWAKHIVLVSIENAIHKPTGYFVDLGRARRGEAEIPLTEVFARLSGAALEEAGIAPASLAAKGAEAGRNA